MFASWLWMQPIQDSHHSRWAKPKRKRFMRNLFGGDYLSGTCDRGSSSTKMHIRIYGIPAYGSYKKATADADGGHSRL
jgi:hypothetical protein